MYGCTAKLALQKLCILRHCKSCVWRRPWSGVLSGGLLLCPDGQKQSRLCYIESQLWKAAFRLLDCSCMSLLCQCFNSLCQCFSTLCHSSAFCSLQLLLTHPRRTQHLQSPLPSTLPQALDHLEALTARLQAMSDGASFCPRLVQRGVYCHRHTSSGSSLTAHVDAIAKACFWSAHAALFAVQARLSWFACCYWPFGWPWSCGQIPQGLLMLQQWCSWG